MDPDKVNPPSRPGRHYAEAERRLACASACLEDPVRARLVAAGTDPARQAEYEVGRAAVHALLATVSPAVAEVAPRWSLATPVVATVAGNEAGGPPGGPRVTATL